MREHRIAASLTIAIAIAVAADLLSAAEPATLAKGGGETGYGHKDFVPTPERPIYFRAGNGEYPGATPPLEWWEGTPTNREVEYRHRIDGNRRKARIEDFADTRATNILWKVPVPGWTLSHPIVVKGPSSPAGSAAAGRVFAVGEPDFVTCWDVNTGRVLWQRRIMPLLCDGMPEEKAVAGQKVLDLAFDGPESVSGTITHQFPGIVVAGGHFLTGTEGTMLGDVERGQTLYTMADGKPAGVIPGGFNHDLGTVVAGKYLILARASDRLGADRKRIQSYTVVDIGDPANPKVVSSNNLLGNDAPTADIILQTYFKDLDPFQFMGCYAGAAGYFAEMGGSVPHGNKLLVQSSAYL